MNRAKLALLLLVSFVATGSIVYQIKSRRPARGAIVGSPPQPRSGPDTAPGGPVVRSASLAVSADTIDVGKARQVREPAPNIPATGWGRNPFLTIDEINKMNQPDQPVAVEKPQTKPQAEPPALPLYVVTGIISGGQGRWVIL